MLHDEAVYYSGTVKQWVKDYTNIYQTKHVTPYTHILAKHVPEFLKCYGNLITFKQQGLEKLNNQITINFARNTNHNYRNLDALKQLMQKKNRVESLEDSKVHREVRSYTCMKKVTIKNL